MRLNAGGEVSPDNARHMGLFVVGRLAQQHDMTVRLLARGQRHRAPPPRCTCRRRCWTVARRPSRTDLPPPISRPSEVQVCSASASRCRTATDADVHPRCVVRRAAADEGARDASRSRVGRQEPVADTVVGVRVGRCVSHPAAAASVPAPAASPVCRRRDRSRNRGESDEEPAEARRARRVRRRRAGRGATSPTPPAVASGVRSQRR